MTAYKRPVFFDRDIKAFSELSADSGLDLGIVARSILADAALQVGTTGSAGTVSVKSASDVPAVTISGNDASISIAGNGQFGYLDLVSADGWTTFHADSEYGNASFSTSSGSTVATVMANARTFNVYNSAGTTPSVVLNGATATATIGGPADGTVSVKNASDAETIKLDGASATATIGAQFNGGALLISDPDGVANLGMSATMGYADAYVGTSLPGLLRVSGGGSNYAISLDGAGTATLGSTGHDGTVSVKNASNAETIALSGATGSITLSGAASKISGLVLSEITGSTDAASKGYVDSIAQGLQVKGACHVSSQGNIEVLATTTEVDGHTLSVGERVLVRYQSDAIENGIYSFNGTGLERAVDMAAGSHAAGAFTFVQFGTNADQGWVCTADAPADVVGTDALPWTQFSAAGVIEAGDGLQLIGTVMSAKLNGTTLSASAAGLEVVGLPSLFEVNGVAVGEGVSAANLTTLTSGALSNASALHSHFGDRITLPLGSVEAGRAAIVNASGQADLAGTTSAGAWVVGFCTGTDSMAGEAYIVRSGLAANVLASATPGDVYYLQANGTVGTALPTEGRVIMIGVALSAADLFVQIRDFGSILAA